MKKILPYIYLIVLFSSSVSVNAQTIKSNPEIVDIGACLNTMYMDSVATEESGWHYFFLNSKNPASNGWYIKMSYVEPGKRRHGAHTHKNDEIIFILEGKAEIEIDGKTQVVGPNTSVYYPKGSKHGLRNAGDEPMKYLVIKKDE